MDIAVVQGSLPAHITVTSSLGHGGQGHVFLGEFRGTQAAIKLYRSNQSEARIRREIDALRHIVCPAIASLIGDDLIRVGADDYRLVATEYIAGESLESRLTRGPATRPEVLGVVEAVATGIEHLWARRIVHRDIKPANIMLGANGRICLIDLGVARHVDRTSLTTMGFTWGTRGYMSPEQAKCLRQLTCKSDIYSLGVTTIEALLGRHPTALDQAVLMTTDVIAALPQSSCDAGLRSLVRQLLMQTATQRPLPSEVIQAVATLK